MADIEDRKIIGEALELLKTQMVYVRNLHDAFGAFYDAVMRLDPRLKQFFEEEMPKIRPNGVQQSAIEGIDRLIRRLEKSE